MVRIAPVLAALLLGACSSVPATATGDYTVTTYDADGRALGSWTVPKIERLADGGIRFDTPSGPVTASGSYLITRSR